MHHELPTLKQIDRLVAKINPHLRGKGPLLQGAVLADLVAMYFAGHHPMIREDAIGQWLQVVRNLIPVNEDMLRKHYKPEGWDPS